MQYKKAGTLDIIKYGFGGIGSNIPFALAMSYLTFFYTDIFGISSIAVAGLMMVARLIDAFTDPIMGMIGDRTRSKLGRFRPWIIFGAPVLGFSVFLIFYAPDLAPNLKLVYAYVTYIFYSLATTAVNIPYQSLTPVMSEDPDQRTIVVASKQGLSVVAMLFSMVFTMPLVNVFGGGQKGWAMFAILSGVLTTLSFWMCAWGGKKYDTMDKVANAAPFNLKKQLQLLYKNKPLMMLMIACGTDVLAAAAANAVNVYYFKYVLHRVDLVPITSLLGLIPSIIMIPFIPMLAKKFGKKRLYLTATALSIVPLTINLFIPTAFVSVIVSMLFVLGFTMKIAGDLSWGMLPDCVDYGEWKLGIRGEGTVSSSLTFINKFGMALGGSAASLILGLVGFTANVEQTPLVLNTIIIMRFGLPILGYIASLLSMRYYELTKERMAEIRTDLNERYLAKQAENK
ncbi:MAG: MFS transporter [Oscillospiraceae bacterium]|nr:MFS transporter [Oscillospiraceae bacterium]